MLAAAMIGTVASVKQTYTQREGNMEETMTNRTFLIDNLDDVQNSIGQWYDAKAKPFIQEHRQLVWRAALAEVEEEKGTLLETCDEGTKCRDLILEENKVKIERIWQIVLDNFNKNVNDTVAETRTLVDTNWSKLVECGKVDCC